MDLHVNWPYFDALAAGTTPRHITVEDLDSKRSQTSIVCDLQENSYTTHGIVNGGMGILFTLQARSRQPISWANDLLDLCS